MVKLCDICGKSFETNKSNKIRCSEECTKEGKKRSSIKAVSRRRRKVVALAKEYTGNKCVICEYDKCVQALDLHHVNPKEKEFQISNGNTYSLVKVLNEANKCVILCANCHREHHAGLISTTILSEILLSEQEERKRRAETIIGKPKLTPKVVLCTCGVEVSIGANSCKRCAGKAREKIDWPSSQTLVIMVRKSSYSAVGRNLGVSDNAVRKRITNHPVG